MDEKTHEASQSEHDEMVEVSLVRVGTQNQRPRYRNPMLGRKDRMEYPGTGHRLWCEHLLSSLI